MQEATIKWIPVTEGLPELNKTVLVSTYCAVYEARREEYGRKLPDGMWKIVWRASGGYIIETGNTKVTAWAEEPEPYIP